MGNIFITNKQQDELNRISKSRNGAQKLAQRAEIILLAADGQGPASIAKNSGVHRSTATRWINRWLSCFQSELPVSQILDDDHRTGAPSLFAPDQIYSRV